MDNNTRLAIEIDQLSIDFNNKVDEYINDNLELFTDSNSKLSLNDQIYYFKIHCLQYGFDSAIRELKSRKK